MRRAGAETQLPLLGWTERVSNLVLDHVPSLLGSPEVASRVTGSHFSGHRKLLLGSPEVASRVTGSSSAASPLICVRDCVTHSV